MVRKPEYAKYIDHTVLKSNTTKATVKRFCEEAIQYGFASVCINGCFAKYASHVLAGSSVKVCVVVGFPLGANTTTIKRLEATDALENGASEIDMVINIGALIEGDYDYVYQDIVSVVDAVHPRGIVKVILETSDLTDEQIIKGCEIALRAKADFVKTSSGFGQGGATVHAVELMKKTVGNKAKIKASTGINNRKIADEFIKAGAVRFGTSKGMIIVDEE